MAAVGEQDTRYRGRLAPSPTGLLHKGHAVTFWKAFERAQKAGGDLILRIEDLDSARCRPEYVQAAVDDLQWLGCTWTEGPDCGGPFGPYIQSLRIPLYLAAWQKLLAGGYIYPCSCSRRDIAASAGAPHAADDEPIYPGTCAAKPFAAPTDPAGRNWRFRVPKGRVISFEDLGMGPQRFTAGVNFGDFPIWRKDGVPSYQLAVVVDDAAMRITEVVRGADLLVSTARQILLYEALELKCPDFHHCPLVLDESGNRLSKRDQSTTLQALRQSGASPHQIRKTGG